MGNSRIRRAKSVLAIGALISLVLAGCDSRSSSAPSESAEINTRIEQLAVSAQSPEAGAALREFARSGALAQKRDFLAGKYSVPINEEMGTKPPVMGGPNCKPRGCRVRVICRGTADNPCDPGSIDVDCDTPC